MDVIEFVLKFFVFLIPGICSALLYDRLNIRKERHYYMEILRLFFVSFVSFAIVDLLICAVTAVFPRVTWKPVDVIRQIGVSGFHIDAGNVAGATIAALVLTCFLVKAQTENLAFRIANKLHLTKRIDNQPVWEHAFDNNNIVVLRDRVTTNTYYGKVAAFSDNSEIRELILKDVFVFDQEGERLYHAESIYLSRNHNEFTIETYNDQDDDNAEKEECKENGKQ